MITMTWTKAPADLLGLGGLDVRPLSGSGLCSGSPERAAAPVAIAEGTGLFAGGTAVRLRPDTRRSIAHDVLTRQTFTTNGTTLGIHSSRRPR